MTTLILKIWLNCFAAQMNFSSSLSFYKLKIREIVDLLKKLKQFSTVC